MAIHYGNNNIGKVYFGNSEVSKIYFGQVEIYSAEEQLAAPTLSLEGDTLTITDNSEMAESFDIYVDGVLEANVPTTSGYTVNYTINQTEISAKTGLLFFDSNGYDPSAPYVAIDSNDATVTGTFTCTSGYLFIMPSGSGGSARVTSSTESGGVTRTSSVPKWEAQYTVNGDGSITISVNYDV